MILDVDSTLCGVEGIDWLARRCGGDVAKQTALLTDRAMNGEIPLESVYGRRLALIRPTLRDVAALSEEYKRTLAPRAAEVIADLRAAGVAVILVSGGIRQAIEPLALQLGLARDALSAVELHWDNDGEYAGFDAGSSLTNQRGKLDIVQRLSPRSPCLAVGDGATDAAMRPAVDAFAAYTGFVQRDAVVARADFTIGDYDELARRVLAAT